MSFIHSLKRAFGLSEDYGTEDEIVGGDDTEVIQTPDPEPLPQKQPVKQIDSTALSADIFESVVALFNESQPEFIKKCLDTDAQKAFILSNIDSAVKQRLDAAVENARLQGQCLWEEERQRLGCEVETLKKEKKALEQNREESKTARLSAERQKRALTERVHDLETQILNLSAEKEQYILENRSMLNKLRVASVTGGLDSEEIAEKIAELTSRAEAAESELKAANERAQQALESAAQQTPDNADADMAAAKDAVKNEIIAALLKKYGDLHSQADKTAAELDAALADIKSLMTLKDQVQQVQEIIDKKDARIASLKRERQQNLESIAEAGEKNEALLQEIERLKEQIEQLNSTIADNLADNAKLMQAQQQQQHHAPAPQPKKKSSRRGAAKPRISAIDELIDSTDWLVATPPMPLPKETEKEDDFGYKDPQRKNHSEDDRQLSLW